MKSDEAQAITKEKQAESEDTKEKANADRSKEIAQKKIDKEKHA